MAQRIVYVPERDIPMWQAAEQQAERHKTSLSRLVADALADYLPRAAKEPAPADRWAALTTDAA